MILQEKNYISMQQKKYLKYGLIWTIVVLAIFMIGLMLTGTRANLFTVSACLLAIVASLYITRYISFRRFKDADLTRAQLLEKMQGEHDIYHSAIIPTAKETAYFEHIVVTENKIYFIAYTKEQVENYGLEIQEILSAKGLNRQQTCFLVAKDANQMENHIRRIEKELNNVSKMSKPMKQESVLAVYSAKISEILM